MMIKFLQKILKRTNRKKKKIVKKFEDREMELVAARSVELLVELQKNNPAFAEELKKNTQLLSDALTVLKTDDLAAKGKFIDELFSTDEIMKEYYRKQLLNSNLNSQLPN